MLHYWFVQAATNPSTAPLVLWLNGGPGCSSLDGFFYEMGPIHFAKQASLGLVYNNFTWTTIANMIFLESPAGVGFSYTTSGSIPQYNDTGVATDNYNFLVNWFAAFPSYKTNPFWITGESYAGVYVPKLGNLVMQAAIKKTFPGNFKGVMVGNGVTNADGDNVINDPIDFMVGHGFISWQNYAQILKACPDPNNPSSACNNMVNSAMDNMNDINIYNVYADCYSQRSPGSPPCIDSNYARMYLNRADLQQAIHVKSGINWEICNFEINGEYDRTSASMVPIYQNLLKNKFRVLIYSGDCDFAVPYTGSAFWTSNMKMTVSGQPWRQWTYVDANGEQVAGFVTDYKEGLSFATIRGAGHMVPQYRPQAAITMFSKFLAGQPL